MGDASFDAYYFTHGCGVPYQRDEHWTRFFGGIADQLVDGIHPHRVLDAGCALGLLVEALRDRGVDAEGVDVSSFAIANVYAPIKPFCRHGSIADEFPANYDLIVSIEVIEHMPAREGDAAIANICRHTDDVLFSSSPFDHRETSHVNVQPPEYWAERFARHGFYRDVDYDASFVTPWAIRFRRSREPLARIVRDFERRFWVMSYERNEMRAFSMQVERQRADAVAQVAGAEEKLQGMAAELAHARDTIAQMERSGFWRMRRAWVTINRLFGRST